MPRKQRPDSTVNERTGEVVPTVEYVENLRALERSIEQYDRSIVTLKEDLKETKAVREKAVAALRSGVRDGKVLPLLELHDDEATAV